MKSHTEKMLAYAKKSGVPQSLQHGNTGTVYFPNGEFMSVDELEWFPRNRSFFVAPDAVRSPGLLMRKSNDLCTVWFAWFDGALHGQFTSRQTAIDAGMA